MAGAASTTSPDGRNRRRELLLACGILAPALYLAGDLACGLGYPGYSFADQAISELSATGAPTRRLWIVSQLPFGLLLIALGFGVRAAATDHLPLRIAGTLLIVWGVTGYAWLFFPMNMRGAIGSTRDTMHLVMAALTVPLMLIIIGFGSGAAGRGFRAYSILTLLATLVFGVLTGLQAPAVAAQLPTPWMGVTERISVYAVMLWLAVLAAMLMRARPAAPER
jgi:hypothetical protein